MTGYVIAVFLAIACALLWRECRLWRRRAEVAERCLKDTQLLLEQCHRSVKTLEQRSMGNVRY